MRKTTGDRDSRATGLWLDLCYGIRTLRRSPGFTVVALITLALGIGAATAMFSVLDTAMRRSLPFPEAERLVLGRATFGGNVNPWVSFPDYMDYRDESKTLESLATMGGGSDLVTITGTGDPEQARIAYATSNIFVTLGVVPRLGRPSTLDELPEGYYYEHHLVGLNCHSPSGEVLGSIVGVDTETAQTRLLVRRGRREYLVPYVPEIVTSVDIEGGTVTIDPPAGLLDDESEPPV